MSSLYRNYRPKNFEQLVGHEAITRALKAAVVSEKLAHGYVFSGTRGVGKTSVARILAKAANCTDQRGGDACLACENCLLLDSGRFVDVVEIDAASHTGVENVREIIEHTRFQPALGKFKFYIIDEVHMLSRGAFNALLKTLEEPPAHVVFILATTELHKVPLTILSRTQRFEFTAFAIPEIEEVVLRVLASEQKKMDPNIVTSIAKQADGSMRDALTLLEKVLLFGDGADTEDIKRLLGVAAKDAAAELLILVGQGSSSDLPKCFSELELAGADALLFNREILELMEFLLSSKLTKQVSEQTLEVAWSKLGVNEAAFVTRLFLRSYKDIPSSPDRFLPLLLAAAEAAEYCVQKSGGGSQTLGVKSPENFAPQSRVGSQALKTEVKPAPGVSADLPQTQESNLDLELEKVKELWEDLLVLLKKRNGPLATVLSQSALIGVSGSSILVTVKFKFHADSLHLAKNQAILRQCLSEVLGQPAIVNAEVSNPESTESDISLEQASQIFGS